MLALHSLYRATCTECCGIVPESFPAGSLEYTAQEARRQSR